MKNCFMTIHGGKLYMSNITSHVDQMFALLENGLNPFVENLKRMFLGWLAPNLGHLLLACIHALESTTCRTRPSLFLFL